MSDDLVAFLRARLDEDEAAAMAASDGPWTPWRGRPGLGLRQLEHGVALPGQDSGSLVSIATASWLDAEHIARHDPARVLREVVAGQKLLARRQEVGSRERGWDGTECDNDLAELLDGLIRDLIAVYSDHPDYREEWKP